MNTRLTHTNATGAQALALRLVAGFGGMGCERLERLGHSGTVGANWPQKSVRPEQDDKSVPSSTHTSRYFINLFSTREPSPDIVGAS